MKRRIVTILSLVLILVSALTLVACNKKSEGELPSDKYEKVAFAFNGVAKSLSGKGSSTQMAASAKSFFGPVANADTYDGTEAIRTLYSLFDMQERTSDPDFKYDEPPMIQFQYIKALYEEVGKDYEFGKIYTGTITGTADFDFATGEKTVRQDYTCEARIDIDIDDRDLITVHLGLKTVYTHGAESHEQRFYAELYLDYDMAKTEPNYELAMKYVDDCSRFTSESERTNTYEYDFVNVKQGAISEWRKLYYCSPTRLVKDADHTSFASYADTVLYGGRAHAYKDGVKYATNHTDVHGHAVNYELRRSICALFFDSFGLNATDIASDAYFAKTGASNPALKLIFDKFAEITGEDVIAAMAVTGADDVYTGTPAENGDNGNGGTGNGNATGGDTSGDWELASELQESILGSDVPLFASAGKVANITTGENECWIDVRGVTEQELTVYLEGLLRAGFVPSAENENNFYKTVDGKDYVVVIASGQQEGIILHFACTESKGDATGGDQGGKTDGYQDGSGDQGGKTDGDEGGKTDPSDPPSDPPAPVSITIDVYYVEGGKIIDQDYRDCFVGQVIDSVEAVFGGSVYYDSEGMNPLPSTFVVTEELTAVYVVRSGASSEIRVYIMDVDAEGNEELYASEPVAYGTSYAFRYYEYVLFEDAACTKVIDPNVPRTLTEDVTVYRRDAMQEVYLYIPTRFFINDFDATFSTAAWCDYLTIRRGKIFEDEAHFGVYPFRDNGTHYYDAGKSSPLFTEKGNCVYFDESNSDVRIFAYLYDPKYQEVTYKCGETVLTKALLYEGETLGWGSIDYYGYWIENPVLEGNVVKVDSYTRLNRITVKHVINGKVVGENHMYFKVGDYEIYEEEEYYSDATLSTPYYGNPTGSMTLYKDFSPER